ncbi:MAG TPA: DNA cytosine methyltransferase, partial [Stenomitos sp.]
IGVDLFAGAGGMSLGFEQAGFDVVAAVEIDPIHAAVHRFNFPHCVVLPQSVSQLTGDAIRKAAGISTQTVDVVFGGAPCQGFSLIGQRALDDPRNALVQDFVRLVRELNANYFVFENVKGLTVGKHRLFLEELIAAFDASGYRVRLPWQVLNASFFGVPQNRERLILMGAKADCPLPDYPSPITRPAGVAKFASLDLPEGPSCQDALGDLPDPEQFEALLTGDRLFLNHWPTPQHPYTQRMRGMSAEAWHCGYPRLWNPKWLTASSRTNHSETSRQRFSKTLPGHVEPISRFFKLAADGVANTLRAGTDSARGAFTSPRPIHYSQPRCITVREMARLHGFPDWFGFHHTKWHGARQIGNSVPPPLAYSIATQVLEAIQNKPQAPEMLLSLGENSLLTMDMTQAANYWQIAIPIGRRSHPLNRRQTHGSTASLTLPLGQK